MIAAGRILEVLDPGTMECHPTPIYSHFLDASGAVWTLDLVRKCNVHQEGRTWIFYHELLRCYGVKQVLEYKVPHYCLPLHPIYSQLNIRSVLQYLSSTSALMTSTQFGWHVMVSRKLGCLNLFDKSKIL